MDQNAAAELKIRLGKAEAALKITEEEFERIKGLERECQTRRAENDKQKVSSFTLNRAIAT